MHALKPTTLAAALALLLLGATAWSHPLEPTSKLVGKVHVELKDLDLRNPADAHTLLERLKQAAYRACGGDAKLHNSYRTRPEQTLKVYEECRVNAVKRAIDQIGTPLLAQAYADDAQRATAGGECIDEQRRAGALTHARSQAGT